MKQLFIAFMLSCLLPLAAYADDSGTCGDNLTWTYVEATHTLTISGTGKMPDYSYSSSSPWYLYRTTIKTAIIEEGVTTIGKYAFYGCSGLTSVTIPNSVTIIGLGAFQDCSSLTSITIPNSVTTIGNEAFYECSGLTSVTIPNSVTTIGNNAFLRCRGLTSVSIGNSVTSIGEFAFAVCSSLTSVNIPNSVTTIGPDAFLACSSLTSITISKGVTSIGNQAFTSWVFARKEGMEDSEKVTQDIDVSDGLKGDVDGDGVVDIADAVRIVNFIVGKIPALAPRIPNNLSDPE